MAYGGDRCVQGGATQAFHSASGCVSSYLPPQAGNRYDINSLFDGRTDTAWCEGKSDHGVGEKIVLKWTDAAPLRGVFITNGYTKSNKVFYDNSRIRDLEVRIKDAGSSKARVTIIRLPDSPLEEQIQLPWRIESPAKLVLKIKSVYPGNKWKDTCVSELWVDFGF